MRIVFVCGVLDTSSTSRVVALHAQHLALSGHDVTVVSVPAPQHAASLTGRILARLGGGASPAPAGRPLALRGLDAPRSIVLERTRAVTARDVPQADVVVATSWQSAEWVNAFPVETGVKVYLIQQARPSAGEPTFRFDATWRMPLHKIAVTSALVAKARDAYGDPDAQCVPSGVDLERFEVAPRARNERLTLGFVYSGDEALMNDTLDALVIARSRVPLKVVAYGDRAPARELPLPTGSRFELRPSLNALPRVYAACDAWIVAGRTEDPAHTALEAMATRTPVICPRVGGVDELVADSGWLVGDPWYVGVADAIADVASLDASAWRARSEAAYAQACANPWVEATRAMEAALRRAFEMGPR